MVAHVLLVILQFTLLQWHMQLVQATPAGQGAFMADCLMESQADTATPAGNPPPHMDDCCSGHMALDCQYHCSAGGAVHADATRIQEMQHMAQKGKHAANPHERMQMMWQMMKDMHAMPMSRTAGKGKMTPEMMQQRQSMMEQRMQMMQQMLNQQQMMMQQQQELMKK